MNNSATAFLLNDNVRAIACIFQPAQNQDFFREKNRASKYRDFDEYEDDFDQDNKAKRYTYKSIDPTVKVGDMVVVECKGPSNNFDMAVVRVVEVDVDVDFDAGIDYKWIISIPLTIS